MNLHARLGIPMDRMYCRVNDFNHGNTSHELVTVLQYKEGRIWKLHQRCKLCDFDVVSSTDAPLKEYVNVER